MLIKISYYILEDIAQGISVIKKRPGEAVKLEYVYDRIDIESVVMWKHERSECAMTQETEGNVARPVCSESSQYLLSSEMRVLLYLGTWFCFPD